jgi:hypothetical protein
LPVLYPDLPEWDREPFARLILEAAYEATLLAALQNFRKAGHAKVYLTLLGGGAFGNRTEWITDAIVRALNLFRDCPLDVKTVSYRQKIPAVDAMIAALQQDMKKPRG